MKVSAVKFPLVLPNDNLGPIFSDLLSNLEEGSVVAITSKIVSVSEGRLVHKNEVANKFDLVKKESEFYVENDNCTDADIYFTIKHNMLIPSAGIDLSNGNDHYILYPTDPFLSARHIWHFLKKINNINNLGVLITDSHTTPMRRGVTGIALSWCGFKATTDLIGHDDLFGYKLRVTSINNIDALASAAVFEMGESSEQTPVAIITEIPKIEFVKTPPTQEDIRSALVDRQDDLYAPVISRAKWLKGGS